jgi:putative transposase
MLAGVTDLAALIGVADACTTLGVPRSSYYRAIQPAGSPKADGEEAETPPPAPRPRPARSLSDAERVQIRDLLNSERFVDSAPRTVYATLLDEQQYWCSWRTMYRILAEAHEIKERRNQIRRTGYAAPELLATQPNQLWSWDITKLRGPATWTYYYLYVILDVFSRAVVGWMIAEREDAELAEILIADTCAKEGITPQQLTIHADRGSAMTSKAVAELLVDLGVAKTHSRPHVSNDNPFSEAQFKTLKYRPSYPDRFGSLMDARAWARPFFHWYNHIHRHSGLGLLSPAVVHAGQAKAQVAARQEVLDSAYAAHPERFVRGRPMAPPAPTAVWINPPASARELKTRDSRANALTGAPTAADPGVSRVSAAQPPLDTPGAGTDPAPDRELVVDTTNTP